jgi:hypothetical protein
MDGSIEDLFVRLKHKCVLSDKDGSAKVPRITLRIYVYEIEQVSDCSIMMVHPILLRFNLTRRASQESEKVLQVGRENGLTVSRSS